MHAMFSLGVLDVPTAIEGTWVISDGLAIHVMLSALN